MGQKGFAAGKALLRVSETSDGRLGQLVLAHVIEGGLVDDAVVAPGSQQFEKIQPALRERGCKKRALLNSEWVKSAA